MYFNDVNYVSNPTNGPSKWVGRTHSSLPELRIYRVIDDSTEKSERCLWAVLNQFLQKF